MLTGGSLCQKGLIRFRRSSCRYSLPLCAAYVTHESYSPAATHSACNSIGAELLVGLRCLAAAVHTLAAWDKNSWPCEKDRASAYLVGDFALDSAALGRVAMAAHALQLLPPKAVRGTWHPSTALITTKLLSPLKSDNGDIKQRK